MGEPRRAACRCRDRPSPSRPNSRRRGRPPQPQPCVLDSHWAQDSQATRLLCATAHLHGEYAQEASGTLLDPSFSALAPSWGLDPVALAQHAKLAHTRRLERDRSLRYCLAGMVLIPLAVLALALARGLSPFSVALSIVLVTSAGFVVAWMIVFAHYELIRVSALEAMDGRLAPRDTAPALDAASRPTGARRRRAYGSRWWPRRGTNCRRSGTAGSSRSWLTWSTS